jgi:ribosome-binding factor A
MRKNSIKNRKVNDAVLREISEIIRAGLKDPDVAPMTSVTEVYVAPDLKTCKVYVSVLGDEDAKERTLKGLEHSKGYIRRMLAQNLNMRITPELFFRLDESIEYGNKMSKLIDEVVGKDRGNNEDGEDSGLS